MASSCSDDTPQSDAQPATSTTVASTSSSTATSTSTTSDSPSTTVDSSASPEQEIIDRYVGFWDARFEANTGVPDPTDPALAEFATGAQLENVIAETQRNLEEGLALKRRDDPADFQRVRVISIDGDTAVVQECFVDDGLVVRRDTGEVVNDEITTQNIQGTLVRIDGEWRVSRAELLQESEGVSGCALAS